MFTRITFDPRIMGGEPAFGGCGSLFRSLLGKSHMGLRLKKS